MANNLATLNQATGTDTLSATTGFLGSDATISSSTDFAAEGSRSLKAVATATTTAAVFFNNASFPADYIPVTTGVTYTAVGSCRKGAGSTTVYHTVSIYWYDSAGTPLSPTHSSDFTTSTSQFDQASVTAAAPATAAFANIRVSNSSSVTIGDVFYWDKIGFWEGSGTTWELPNNLLTLNQRTGTDVLQSTTGFTAYGTGVTLSSATDQYHSGARSIKAVCDGTVAHQGIEVNIPSGTLNVGWTYTFSVWRRVSASTDYRISVVNDYFGSLDGIWDNFTPNAWAQWTSVPLTIGTNTAAADTRFRVQTGDTPAAASLWADDYVVSGSLLNVTYSRRLVIG